MLKRPVTFMLSISICSMSDMSPNFLSTGFNSELKKKKRKLLVSQRLILVEETKKMCRITGSWYAKKSILRKGYRVYWGKEGLQFKV